MTSLSSLDEAKPTNIEYAFGQPLCTIVEEPECDDVTSSAPSSAPSSPNRFSFEASSTTSTESTPQTTPNNSVKELGVPIKLRRITATYFRHLYKDTSIRPLRPDSWRPEYPRSVRLQYEIHYANHPAERPVYTSWPPRYPDADEPDKPQVTNQEFLFDKGRVCDPWPATGPWHSDMSKRQDFSRERAHENGEKIRLGEYTLGQTLGEGEFGKVKIGWKKSIGSQVAVVGSQVAVKIIRREKLDTPSRMGKVHREILILKQLNHPNIVRVHEVVETKNTIGIILEYASGGELFDYILQQRYLKDKAAQRLFAQLVSGVGYLHRNGIIHRDLKLENLLLDSEKNIIITDFGFANTFDPTDVDSKEYFRDLERRHPEIERPDPKEHQDHPKIGFSAAEKTGHNRGDLMATSCGSPCYAAPELVVSEGLYSGRKVDSWSMGVILYAMAAGYLPFDDDPENPEGDNINRLYIYISETPLIFPEYVTPHTRDLLKRILVPNPAKRADLFEIARHSWLADYAHLVEGVTSQISPPKPEEYEKTKALKTPIADFSTSRGKLDPVLLSRQNSEGIPRRARQTSDNHGDPGYMATTSASNKAREGLREEQTSRDQKRRTVQVEYVNPNANEEKDKYLSTNMKDSTNRIRESSGEEAYDGRNTNAVRDERPNPPAKDFPPSSLPYGANDNSRRRSRQASASQPTRARPGTGGSIASAPRLPSRGSYGQPSAAAVSTENAHGRSATGSKPDLIYSTQPQADGTAQQALRRTLSGRLVMPPSVESPGQKSKGHKRSSTVGNLSEKLLPRRAKPDRQYPPTSMRPATVDADAAGSPPQSRRSFGFLRKWSNSDMNNQKLKQPSSRRFSLLSPHKKFDEPPKANATSGSSGAARRVADFFRRRK